MGGARKPWLQRSSTSIEPSTSSAPASPSDRRDVFITKTRSRVGLVGLVGQVSNSPGCARPYLPTSPTCPTCPTCPPSPPALPAHQPSQPSQPHQPHLSRSRRRFPLRFRSPSPTRT